MGILLKPIITEKLTAMADKGVYGFYVDPSANKIEIKEAVEQTYNVSVKDVNTIKAHGKRKSRYTRSGMLSGRDNDYKKAFVTLAGNDKIDFYANI
ncbi:MAG: 50S ribosomal protein L23 [Bacteroidales bacterium]|nr:50S ribosomal protein L23 [Bacteroidales bacterium]MBQ4305413.1 50S ribosomal protein L23 [Bacteroidales bacterium]MBQ5943560.1 50S ribosomal protein L23 [Bacteroidales bacterium]